VTRLYIWLQRHPTQVDGALAFMLIALGLVAFPVSLRSEQGPLWVAIPAAVIGAPIVLRRKYPVEVFWVIIFFGALQVLGPQFIWPSDLAIPIALYGLAAYRRRRESLIGLGACLLGVVVLTIRLHSNSVQQGNGGQPDDLRKILMWTIVFCAFCAPMVVAWVMGDSMQYRRAYYVELEERARRLEMERDQQAQIAAATERARIARELHDVVAHNVSVMVVQAEGAAYAMDTAPENTRKALGAIADTGRSALAEMRRLLGVLRTKDGEADRAPQPGIDQLEDLLEQVRSTGLPVDFKIDGVPVELPQGVALAAYRIVQESLTNALKHAAPGPVVVRLGWAGPLLAVEVSSVFGDRAGPRAPGSGAGLVGMRERVALLGGAIETGPVRTDDGPRIWRVRAELPVAEGNVRA
jgi:signal transduction histidine kinase